MSFWERLIIRVVKWLMNLTGNDYAIVYRIPWGFKTEINCVAYEAVMNGMNDAWKRAMQAERKRLTKAYRKERG